MHILRIIYALFLLTLLTASTSLFSAQSEQKTNTDGLEFYLLTYEPGSLIFDSWGHQALRVVDKKKGSDVIYHWGLYDFGEAWDFAVKYFNGIQTYSMAREPYLRMLAYYNYQRRSIWQDHLNLTSKQKQDLLARIEDNLRPENRHYQYHNFYNNCSTKIRDHLDAVLHESISKRAKAEKTDKTFRYYTHAALLAQPTFMLLIDILANSEFDYLITPWEEMFLPAKVRELWQTYPQVSDQGDDLAGTTLLTDTKKLTSFPLAEPSPYSGYGYFALIMTPLLALAYLFWFLGRRHPKKNLFTYLSSAFLGTYLLFYGIFGGLIATLLTVGWAFSGQTSTHHNANLWIFFVIDWVAFYWGLRLLFNQNYFSTRGAKVSAFLKIFLSAHILTYVILIFAYLTHLVIQDVSKPLTIVGPVATAAWILVFLKEKSLRRLP